MRKYKAWYGVTNIFLDEVSSGSGQLAYYRQLADYVHSVNPGSAVMLNPGTYPDQHWRHALVRSAAKLRCLVCQNEVDRAEFGGGSGA